MALHFSESMRPIQKFGVLEVIELPPDENSDVRQEIGVLMSLETTLDSKSKENSQTFRLERK